MTQAQRTNITIDGEDYTVAVRGGEATYRYRPQAQREDDSLWHTWAQQSFHGGERLKRILSDEDLAASRYDDAEGVDVSDWGELKVQPVLERTLEVSSADLPMCVVNNGATLLVGLSSSPYMKKWTLAAGWANVSGIPGAVKDFAVAGSTVYCVTGTDVYTSTNSGTTWSDLGDYTTAVGVAYLNEEVYILKSDGVYDHTNSEAVSSIGGTSICAYRENLYWGKDRRIWRYTGSGVYLYTELPPGFTLTALIPYRMALLILGYYKVQGGYKTAVHYLLQGYENHLYSLGDYSDDHRVYAATGADDSIYIASPARGGVDIYNLTDGGLACGPAWGTAANIPFKSIAWCDGYLFVGRYDGVSATDGVYYADIASPASYRDSGWIKTAEYDFRLPHSQKIFRSVTVEHRLLAAGESIIVEYSTDGGTDYEIAGTIAPSPRTTTEFVLEKVRAYSIKVKLTLNAGNGDLTTPTVTEVRVQAAPVLETKWTWTLTLEAFSQYNGKSKLEGIERLAEAQEVVVFEDLRGEKHNVMVDDLIIEQVPTDKYAGLMSVRLKEV